MLTLLQERVAAIVASLAEAEGFALAGGAALIARGDVQRQTRDLDFFGLTPAAVDVGAAALAVEGDRFVGVQLHLDLDLFRLAVGDVDPDLAHRLDHIGQIASAGSCPADSARRSAGAYRSKNACAIWERPALCVQTNKT